MGAAPSPEPTPQPSTLKATTAPATTSLPTSRASSFVLYPTAKRALQHIVQHESMRDATCWTTVRMMEHFYARRPLSEAASFLKIEVSKVLMYRLWRHASTLSSQPELSRQDISAALPKGLQRFLQILEQRSQAKTPTASKLKHYHRVTENWRLLLAIAMESLVGEGLFQKGWVDVKPLAYTGMKKLTDVSTVLNLRLLQLANKAALHNKHHTIQFGDIREGYLLFLKELQRQGLGQRQGRYKVRFPIRNRAKGYRLLRKLTLQNMDQKVLALRSWNKSVWKGMQSRAQMLSLLNRLSPIALDREALDVLFQSIQVGLSTMAQGVSQGTVTSLAAPLQRAAVVQPHNFKNAKAQSYLTTRFVMERLGNLFPHQTLVNGDVKLWYAQMTQKGPVFATKTLMGPSLDAVRDVTLHWSILRELWGKMPSAKPLSPFAAEVLAERVSEFIWFFLHMAKTLSPQSQKLTGAQLRRLLVRIYRIRLLQPLPEHFQWGAKEKQRKQALMKKYQKGVFGASLHHLFGAPCPALKSHLYKGKFAFSKSTSHPYVPPTRNSLANPHRDPKSTLRDGLDHHYPGLLVYNGASVSAVDYDNDGDIDLFFTGEGCNRLFRNQGGYRFEDVTAKVGLNNPHYDSHQALFADVNNDGRLDLLVLHAVRPSRLFIQRKDGRFQDKTKESGIQTTLGANTAVFFDYDNDGKLDLYIGYFGAAKRSDHQLPSVDGRNGRPNVMYRNLGNGRFQDVTASTGTGSTGWSMAFAAMDFNQDGHIDLFVANDFGHDELFLNQGNGRFREVAKRWGLNDRTNGMNASVTDINQDGKLDLYVSVIDMFSKDIGFILPKGNTLVRMDEHILRSVFYLAGNKFYVSDTKRKDLYQSQEQVFFEPGFRGWSWSGVFFDFDNDGDEDFYLANGWAPQAFAANQKNQLFVRDGKRFFLFSHPTPVVYKSNSRSAVAADLSGTGRMDLLLNDYGTGPKLFPNKHTSSNRWLKVKLRGVRSNRFGVGATIRVLAKGLAPQMRLVTAGTNYLSQSPYVQTFGLGKAQRAEAIVVTWPNGAQQKVKGPFVAGRTITVTEVASN